MQIFSGSLYALPPWTDEDLKWFLALARQESPSLGSVENATKFEKMEREFFDVDPENEISILPIASPRILDLGERRRLFCLLSIARKIGPELVERGFLSLIALDRNNQEVSWAVEVLGKFQEVLQGGSYPFAWLGRTHCI